MKRIFSLLLALILVAPVLLAVVPTAEAIVGYTSYKISDYFNKEILYDDYTDYIYVGSDFRRYASGHSTDGVYSYVTSTDEIVTCNSNGGNFYLRSFYIMFPNASAWSGTELFYIGDIISDSVSNVFLNLPYSWTCASVSGRWQPHIYVAYYDSSANRVGYQNFDGDIFTGSPDELWQSFMVELDIPEGAEYVGFALRVGNYQKGDIPDGTYCSLIADSFEFIVRDSIIIDSVDPSEETEPVVSIEPSTEATTPDSDSSSDVNVNVDMSGVESRLDGVEDAIGNMNSSLGAGIDEVEGAIGDMSGEVCEGLDDVQGEVEKSNGFLGGILDGILGLPQKLLDGIKGLFVPDAEAMQEYSEKWETLLSERFGVIYQCIDIIASYAETFTQREEQNTIEFPAVTIDLAGVPFTFGGWSVRLVPEGFEFITDAIKMVVNFIALGLFLNTMRKKYDNLMGGQ